MKNTRIVRLIYDIAKDVEHKYLTSQVDGFSHEEIYLKQFHKGEQEILDLHTYFWTQDMEVCPICNEWLVMRSKPEATV